MNPVNPGSDRFAAGRRASAKCVPTRSVGTRVDDYSSVLMDCMMPEMSGYEATAAIRHPASSVRRRDIPVIALTGNAMKQDVELCIAAGMDDHLTKPLILDELLAKLKKWVA